MFRTVLLSVIRRVFHYTHSNGICHTGLLTACEQGQPLTASQRAEFYSKNKFEKLVHLVDFIIRNYQIMLRFA